jgi:hypothetical protein
MKVKGSDRRKMYKIIQKTFMHIHNHQQQEPSVKTSKILPASLSNIIQ